MLVDFQSGLDKIDEETKDKYRAKGPGEKNRMDEILGVFGKMDPMPGAIEAVRKLAEGYDRNDILSDSLSLLSIFKAQEL